MKICRDVIWSGRNHRRLNTLSLLGTLALFAGALAPCTASAQTKSQVRPGPRQASRPQHQSELVALHALMKRVAAQSPRPAKVSATQVRRNGYWETQDLRAAWFGVMRRFLPTVRDANPDLISYWVIRTEDQGFATKMHAVVASVTALSPWAGQLQAASDALIQEARQDQHIPISGAPDQEREAMGRALDLDDKRQELIKVIRGILGAAGDLDPERNGDWKPLSQFLSQDADTHWTAALQDREEKTRVAFELHKSFWGATQPPAAATARFEKLEAIDRRLNGMRERLLESAITPGQTPMAFLQGDAQAFIDTQIAFDRELVRALDSPEARADPSLIRVFDGLYPVWESLDRYEDFLRAGRWPQSVDVLVETARVVLMAESWEWTDIDAETGKSTSDFAVQRAGQTIDLLNKYKASWRDRGAPDVPLYAAVEVDAQGRRVATHFSWILWKWTTAGDLDDLKIDGRVAEGLGRRWVLPPGSPVKAIRSLQDVHTSGALELIVGLDPARRWQAVRKAAQ